jgi:tetratricopeptide (TPR) repeat protein
MPSQHWNRLKSLFAEASELPAGERAALLDAKCGPELRAELEILLANHDRECGAIERLQPPAGIVARATSPGVFVPGETVAGRYRIESFLGEGGMGEVYAAFDQELGERVALKTVRGGTDTEQWLDRFRREVQLARKVTHPNVCRIFELGKHRGILFLTMEMIEGETLAYRIKAEGGMKPEQALPLIRQIASALDAAHAAGVVHRDLKSGNIMLATAPDGSARAVVTDFGLAHRMPSDDSGQSSTTGLSIGTPAYMSPEQIEGRSAGPAADIYALGVVLYEMVTGALPYESRSPLAIAAQKVHGLPQPPSACAAGVNARWDAVILRCLAFDPKDRFGLAQEVVDALEGRRLAWRRRWRWPHRPSRVQFVAMATVLLALCVWLLIRYWPTPSPEARQRLAEGEGAMADGAMLRARNLLQRGLEVDPGSAILHARLAECLWELDSLDRAKDEVLLAARDHASGSDARYLDGMQRTALRDFAGAVAALAQRAAGARGSQRARALLDLARAQERNEDAKAATATYAEVLKADPRNGTAMRHLGRLASRAQQPARAYEWLAKAERAFLAVGNYEGVAAAIYERGLALRNEGKSKEAEAALSRALERARATDDVQIQVRCQYQLAALALDAGESERSENLVQTAVELARGAGQESLALQGWVELGNIHLRRSRFSEAERCYTVALDEARRSRSQVGEARALVSLASLADNQDRLELARKYAIEAAAFYRKGGYRRNLSAALMLDARAANGLGDYAVAEPIWSELLASATARGEPPQIALCEEGLGFIRLRQGLLPGARDHYQRALAMYTKTGREDGRLSTALRLAEIAWSLGENGGLEKSLAELQGQAAGMSATQLCRLATVRTQFAVSRRRKAEATQAAAELLRRGGQSGGSLLCAAQAHAAEAEAVAGRRTPAVRLRDQSLACAAERKAIYISVETLLAAAETSSLLGEKAATQTFAQQAIELALRFGHREDAWHAALLMGPERSGSPAVALAAELRNLWGERLWASYCSRPDRSTRTELFERKKP